MNVSRAAHTVIRWSFYLLFILVPLILTPWNYELFEYNKMMLTYGLAAVIVGSWILKMAADREIRIAKTPLDLPIGLFVLSQLISSLFSIDPHVSWFGYYSRFNGGMWSVITYALLYWAFVTNFDTGETKTQGKQIPVPTGVLTVLKITLSSATVVALYGIAEHMGIDRHLWVQDVQSRVFSTLGQPNWLAAYLTALLPVSMVFALAHPPIPDSKAPVKSLSGIFKHSVWSVITLLLLVTLLYTRSRSGLVGFAIADAVLWAGILFLTPRKKHYLVTMGIIHIAFAAVIFFNGTNISKIDQYVSLSGIKSALSERASSPAPNPAQSSPQTYKAPLLESGGTESGTIRKYVWAGAIAAWKSTTKTMLIGTGTETFAFAFYRFRPAGHNLTSEWDFLYNKAHNEYLNYLATTGLFGLGSYMVLISVYIWWFLRHYLRNRMTVAKEPVEFTTLATALFAGWVSVLVTNFFGFSVVIVQLFLFLFPAAALVLLRADGSQKRKWYSGRFAAPSWASWLVFLFATVTVIRIALFWYADVQYASGYRDARSSQYNRAKNSLEKAIGINSGEPNYHDEYASILGTFAAAAFEQQNATMAAEFAKQAIEQNQTALSISPQNVNYWKTRTKLFYSFASFNPQLNAQAIESLDAAAKLSPNDPKIYYNLAILYGRGGDNTKAVELLRKAKELKVNYHDAYYALYIFYTEMKKPADARAVLEEYIRNVDPQDKQFTQILRGK